MKKVCSNIFRYTIVHLVHQRIVGKFAIYFNLDKANIKIHEKLHKTRHLDLGVEAIA